MFADGAPQGSPERNIGLHEWPLQRHMSQRAVAWRSNSASTARAAKGGAEGTAVEAKRGPRCLRIRCVLELFLEHRLGPQVAQAETRLQGGGLRLRDLERAARIREHRRVLHQSGLRVQVLDLPRVDDELVNDPELRALIGLRLAVAELLHDLGASHVSEPPELAHAARHTFVGLG